MKELFKIIIVVAMIQALFQGFILLAGKRNKLPNRILSLLLFCSCLSLSRYYFLYSEMKTLYYYSGFITITFFSCFGPLIYIYTQSIISRMIRITRREMIHFLPALLILMYLIIRFHVVGNTRSFDDLVRLYSDDPISVPYIVFPALVGALIYIIFSLRNIMIHYSSDRVLISKNEQPRLYWMKVFLQLALLFAVMLIISYIFFINKILYNTAAGDIISFITLILLMIFTFIVTLISIRHPEVFAEHIPEKRKPYYSYNTSDADLDVYKNRILEFMETKRPYLNDSLTLKEFAQLLEIPSHHISMTLNVALNQSFFNFINSYRIEEAKRMMADPAYDDFNILRIAYEAGFNSKTSFNTLFKKTTGYTPTEYRKITRSS